MDFPAPPHARPSGIPKRLQPRPTIDVTAASHTAPLSSHMTPPATPASAGLETTDTASERESEAALSYDDADEPLFANYLRAFYHFHPTSPVSSVAEGSSVTISINAGDVIFVHSIQPNGWADGTLLSTGARGWLPTNYCEAYEHDIIRNLLNALNNVWDFIRGHEDGATPAIFAKQDYVRGMIAGVRVFLERAKCLSRDSTLIQSHAGLRRMRKGILGELSSFVKAARLLQDVCNSPIAPEALYDILDDLVLKAFKVVTRAVRFLDAWSEEMYLHQHPSPSASAAAVPTHVLPPTPPADELHYALPHKRASGSDLQTPDETVAEFLPSHSDQRPTFRNSVTLSKPHLPARLSSQFITNLGRPTSISSKRASASHRWSHNALNKRGSTMRGANMVSEQLCSAHDAFLSSLGAYIGLHMQSRWSMDLLVTTQQSVGACQSLLALIDEVWERDNRRSDALVEARDTMHASLAELVQATRDIFSICDNPDESEAYMPDQGKRLVDAATLCVRSAGECVTKTRTVIERIGDFEWEAATAAASQPAQTPENTGNQEPASHETLTLSGVVTQNQSQQPARDAIARKSLPPLPLNEGREIDIPSAEPSPSYFQTEGRDPAMLPAPLRTQASGILRAASAASGDTRSSMDTVVPHDRSGRESSASKTAPSAEVAIPRVSSLVVSEGDAVPPEAGLLKTERTESTGVSTSDTNSTYRNSFRNSEQSMVSQVSTRATTPDNEAARDPTASGPSASVSSLTGSHEGSLPEEENDDAAEEQFLAKTYAHELVFNKDGQVTGGSLPALVERLTTHDSTPDAMFVNTFYLTFRLFTAPVEFAQALVDRFECAGDAKDFATPVRLRVYNVFKGWLESHWQPDTDGEALRTILRFATGRLKDCLPSASRRLIELTTKVSETRDRNSVRLVSSFGKTSYAGNGSSVPDGPTPSPVIGKSQYHLLRNVRDGRATASILDFDALELARQITLIESKIFCAIQPEELLAQEWMKKTDSKAFNVKAKSALSTDLANLVADSILSLEEPKKRALVIKQWIKIGRKLLELHNYDSLMAIICSLNSSMVLRLKRTWECVPAKTMVKLEELKTIVDVSKNHATLRQKLQGVVAPCLPFVGMYLTDLTFVDVGNQTTRNLSNAGIGDCTKVINFDKHVKTARIISDLQRFQVPFKLAPIPELQEWMEMQIHRMRESESANVQNYYRRSLALEPRETVKIVTTNLAPRSPLDGVPPTPTAGKAESVKEKLDFWNQFHFPSSKSGSSS